MIDAFEFNNPTSDMRFGAQDVIKNYMMGSYHQAMEFFEIIFNKKKWDTLPEGPAGDPASTPPRPPFVELVDGDGQLLEDLQELIEKHKVNVLRTPKSVIAEQLKAWDMLAKKMSDEDPFFAKVMESQKAWAKRVGYYMFLTRPTTSWLRALSSS